MGRVENEWRGLVVVEARGAEPEALLNACLREGLTPVQPRSLDAWTLRLGIFESELPRLRQLAEKNCCELRILSRRGGSSTRRLLRRRLGLLLTAAFLLASLLASSLFVWEIRVVGLEGESVGPVLRVLADCGVKNGCFWPSLDADAVRDRALPRLPALAWLTVNVRGSVATVKVLRREEKPEIFSEADAADLIASHAGIVRRVSALSGRALVRPGQAVTAGETLVSSELVSITAAPRFVRARGAVLADTWYELAAVCPPSEAKTEASGPARSRFALRFGEKRVNFYRNAGKAIDGYDKIVHEYHLGVNGLFRLPITLVREELRPYETAGTRSGDGEEPLARLSEALTAGVEGEILSLGVSCAEKDGLLFVTLRAHCLENIAVTAE